MLIDKISHSRLQLFYQCPFKYRLKYHEKINPSYTPDYFEFGHFMHRALELIVKNKTTVDEAAKESMKEFFNFDASYLDRSRNMFSNFLKFQEMIYSNDFDHEETEKEFRLNLGDEPRSFLVNGVVDRTIHFNNNKILIVDYKTSKAHNQIKKETANDDKQLLTYMWACSIENSAALEDITSMLFYLESGDKVIAHPEKRKIDLHVQECLITANIISDMDPSQAKANVSRACRFCDYNTICPFYKRSN